MFSNIFLQLNYPNYQQQNFNLSPFIQRAHDLLGENQHIAEAMAIINNYDIEHFSRNNLIGIWNNKEVSFFSKIIITFWWGGLSHLFQAPQFYTNNNFMIMEDFMENLENDLNDCIHSENIYHYSTSLGNIYSSFKGTNGNVNYHMNGINTSFFTKILQFYFYTNNHNHNFPIPIIADKWTMRSVMADMIFTQFNWQNVFRQPVFAEAYNSISIKFLGNNEIEFEKYWNFISYVHNRINELLGFDNLNAFILEEYIFGWRNDMQNIMNPRNIATNIIRNHFNA